MEEYKVYVKINETGYIIDINSSAFITDTEGWQEIDSGNSDKYHHAQGNYFPKPIMTIGGAYCYKLVEGHVVECCLDELNQQSNLKAPLMLSFEERLNALERVSMQAYQSGTWYYRGDRVTFDEKVYICVAPAGVVCVWSPSEYPVYWQN